jgi:hypothetical protein
MKALQGEAEPLRERARTLREEAFAILKALAVSSADAEGTGRTLALYHALDGDVTQAARLAPRPAGDAPRDPWGSLALATAAVRSREGQGREEAVRALAELAATHPELLRVRLTLAQGLALGGQRDAAVRTLDQVLTENPAHERAKAYKAELLAPPPVALVPVPAPPGAPPARPPGNLPRLKDGEAGTASASTAGGALPKGTKGGKGTKAKATKPRTGQGKASAPPGGGAG